MPYVCVITGLTICYIILNKLALQSPFRGMVITLSYCYMKTFSDILIVCKEQRIKNTYMGG